MFFGKKCYIGSWVCIWMKYSHVLLQKDRFTLKIQTVCQKLRLQRSGHPALRILAYFGLSHNTFQYIIGTSDTM